MCCTTETYATIGDLHSLGLIEHSHGRARPLVTGREIRRTGAPAPDGSRLMAARAVPDTTKADPEHIWGDEGPVNE